MILEYFVAGAMVGVLSQFLPRTQRWIAWATTIILSVFIGYITTPR